MTNSPSTSSALASIDDISDSASRIIEKVGRDEKDDMEERDLDRARGAAEVAKLEQENKDKEANRGLRYTYAQAVFSFLCWYSIACFFLIILSGFKKLGFSLPDIVLTTLVGSTAASAIGLVGFVVNGLFRPPS